MKPISFFRLKDMVMREVNFSFLEDMAECLKVSYASTEQNLPNSVRYCPATSKDLWPHTRRALIETSMKILGEKYPGILTQSRPNKIKSCSHVEVKFGNILLTQSHVAYKDEPVRGAIFRQKLAASSCLYLPMSGVEAPSGGKYIYGLLKHGYEDEPSRVSFFCLEIPLRGKLDQCLRIDLSHMLGIETAPSVRPEIITDQVPLTTKQKTKEVKKSG